MRVPKSLFRAAIVLASLVASVAFAQGTSVITGTVTDAATGKPVPDVVITATSPAMQGEEVVVTDSAGLYRLAQLPAGTYVLRLEKESYKPYSRPDIAVRVDRTVRVNIQLQPEAIKEEIVVVGKPPTVDVGSTTTGLSVGKEFINNIAFIQPGGSGVRSFESLAAVAPQVQGDSYGYGFSGAQSPENLYVVDGVSVSNAAYGTNGAQFPVEFVEEANVITGGYMAEFGRATGGVLNVVTKSGSNEFHGSVWGNWTPGLLVGAPKEIKNDSSSFVGKGSLWNTVDFGAEVGGPIMKDRLWFYAGFSPSFARVETSRSLRRFLTTDACRSTDVATFNRDCDYLYDADGFIQTEALAGTTKSQFLDARAFSYIGKLTYLINADNNLSLSVVGSPTTAVTPRSFNDRRIAGSIGTDNTMSVSLKYAGSFLDKHLLVDANVGWFHNDNSSLPNDGSGADWFNPAKANDIAGSLGNGAAGTPAVRFTRYNADPAVASLTRPHSVLDFETVSDDVRAACVEPTRIKRVVVRGEPRLVSVCPATGTGGTYTIGGAGFMELISIDRYQGKAAVTYLAQALGHHIVKAGLDAEMLKYNNKRAYSGGYFLSQNITGSRFDDLRQFGVFSAPDVIEQQKYVETLSGSTLIGAFLQDSWSVMDLVTLNLGLRYENQQLFGSDGTVGLTLNNMISPRVGVIYDFTNQGRSKLFANYARYYEAVPLDIADRSLSGENSVRFRRMRTANNGQTATGTNPGCDPMVDIAQSYQQCRDGSNAQIINRLVGDEYSVNGAGINIGAGKVPVDPALQPQSTDEIVLGGEYEVISDGRVGLTYTRRYMNAVIEDMSLDEAQTYFIGNPGFGMATAFPKATRDYDAVTLYFTKAFSDGWMGQVSYTWSYLRGNYNGLFRPETDQLDPNINSDFDLISLLPNRDGPLAADRTHYLKAYASKEFVVTGSLSFILGLTFTSRSGAPLNYFAAHPIYGGDESFVLPRGSGGRLPWVSTVNLKGGVSYRVSKDNVVQFTADVFNLFDFRALTAVDETLSTQDLLPYVAPAGKNPQEAACLAGNDPNCVTPIQKYDPDTGEVVAATPADYNPNFKKPAGYQAPISVRFGLRFSF